VLLLLHDKGKSAIAVIAGLIPGTAVF